MKKVLLKICLFLLLVFILLFTVWSIGIYYGKSQISKMPVEVRRMSNSKNFPSKLYFKKYREKGFNGAVNFFSYEKFYFCKRLDFLDMHGRVSYSIKYCVYVFSVSGVDNGKVLWFPFDNSNSCLFMDYEKTLKNKNK